MMTEETRAEQSLHHLDCFFKSLPVTAVFFYKGKRDQDGLGILHADQKKAEACEHKNLPCRDVPSCDEQIRKQNCKRKRDREKDHFSTSPHHTLEAHRSPTGYAPSTHATSSQSDLINPAQSANVINVSPREDIDIKVQERHTRALDFLKTLQENASVADETELENLHAVLGEVFNDEASSSAWLNIPVEAFCGLLLRLVPKTQAYRRTCAALNVLRLRLEALAGPAPRTLVETIVQTGVWHALPLAHVVLAKLMAQPSLSTAQAELLVKVLKESRARSPQLTTDVFKAVADAADWGASWNENTVAVMSHIVSVKPSAPQDRFQRHIGALCAAASLAHLQPSVKFAKLFISIVTAYAPQCQTQRDELLQAAAKGTSFLAKSCRQKVESLLTR